MDILSEQVLDWPIGWDNQWVWQCEHQAGFRFQFDAEPIRVTVTCGGPSGRATSRPAGSCWRPSAST